MEIIKINDYHIEVITNFEIIDDVQPILDFIKQHDIKEPIIWELTRTKLTPDAKKKLGTRLFYERPTRNESIVWRSLQLGSHARTAREYGVSRARVANIVKTLHRQGD